MAWNEKTQSLEIQMEIHSPVDHAALRWAQQVRDGINARLKEWFDKQPRIHAGQNLDYWSRPRATGDTHEAILIGVRPIERPTAESVLRELVESYDFCDWGNRTIPDHEDLYDTLIEKAKRILNKE